MMLDHLGAEAAPGLRSVCPGCNGEIVAKCGEIVTWHWAHVAKDCDPWSEPETLWHRYWKLCLRERGASVEVVVPPHRADVVLPDNRVVELQYGLLSPEEIKDREDFYGSRLIWLYRCQWADRVHHGKRGFWWKRGAKSLLFHRRPVWWHAEPTRLWRVSLGISENGRRVLGKILEAVSIDQWMRSAVSKGPVR